MAASKISKTVAARAVHLQITPSPSNIHERKSLLKKLKEFGEVDSFRYLFRDYNEPALGTALAIFRHRDAASSLLSSSPLQIEASPEKRPTGGILGLSVFQNNSGRPSTDSSKSALSPSSNAYHDLGKPAGQSRVFTVTANPSKFDHYGQIQRQQHYWGFNTRYESAPEQDLQQVVPMQELAIMSDSWTGMPNRVVQRKFEDLQTRPTPKALWDEAQKSNASRPVTK